MKKTILFLILASFAYITNGQAAFGITDIMGFYSKSTIVRSIDDERTLIYTFDNMTQQGTFIYYEHPFGTVLYFDIPKGLNVMDMEINGPNVYFCGNKTSYQAFVGQFNIMGCFFGTDDFYYCTIPQTTVMPVEMKTATRMTTMVDGSDVYILGIGDAEHSYTEIPPYMASTLFSAKLTITPTGGTWTFCVDYQKVRPYTYIDIDCSDNYVVFTATDANDKAYFFVGQHRECFFFNYPNVVAYSIGAQVEKRQLFVKAMNGDHYTLAFVPQGRNWISLVDIPTIPIPTTLNLYSTLPSVSTPYTPYLWEIHDLRHNKITDHPLLLGRMAMPPYDVFDTWVTDFDWGGNTVAQNNILGRNFTSIDGVTGTSNYVVTAPTTPLSLGKEQIPIPKTPCFIEKPVSINTLSFSPEEAFSNHDESKISWPTDCFKPKILSQESESACE